MAAQQQQQARRTRQAVPASSRVAIIGGGISGLAAAKLLAAHDPVVFEATASVGGVWEHCAYRSTRLQTPRPDYEFSDYSWRNRDDPTFPTHAEITEYLEGYADTFGLWRYIMLGATVVDIKFLELWSGTGEPLQGKPMWEVGVATAGSDTVQYYQFEFLLMCAGKYGDVPRMPVSPPGMGPDAFRGQVMHSLDYCKLSEEETVELTRGKKVAVLGYKKSAIDLALECAQANQGKTSPKRGIDTNTGSHVTHQPRYLSAHNLPHIQMLPHARKWSGAILTTCVTLITSKRIFGMAEAGWIRKYLGIWNGLTGNESHQHSDPGSCRSGHGEMAVNTKTSASWIVATAAPHHATGNRNLLSGFVVEHEDQFVHSVNRVPMKVLARGAVVTDSVVLPDVWFVPGLTENLVSVSQLAELDHSIGFGRGECCIRSARDAKIVGKGRLEKGGHYVLDYLTVPLAI